MWGGAKQDQFFYNYWGQKILNPVLKEMIEN